jgi:acyl-CoA thioester hydrolase
MNGLHGRYPLVLTQSLIWGDMDAFQHINNTVYFRYFEDARMAYFDKAGIMEYMGESPIGPIIASTRCDFRAPLKFPDTIQIASTIENIKPKRFTMKYLVYSERLKTIAAEGEGLVVFYDYQQNKSCEIPDRVVAAIDAVQQEFA